MTDHAHSDPGPPNDLAQVQVVWWYELLRYLRSKRLVGSIIIVVAILGLIYAIPPAVGTPYKGTVVNGSVGLTELNISFQGITVWGFGSLKSGEIELDTLEVLRDGAAFPSNSGANWIFVDEASFGGVQISANSLLFMQNVSGSDITASYDWHMPVQEFDVVFINFASILVVICATFFGADSIVGEFQNRTGYLMFPNPMKRSSLFFGKFAASVTAGVIIVGLFYIGTALLSFLTLGAVDDDFGMSFAFAFEYLVAVIAIAYLISSVLRGSTGALVLTFFMFIMILPIVDSVSMFAGVKINASVTFASGAMLYTMYDPYPEDTVNTDFGMTFYQYYPEPGLAALVMLAYLVAALALSLVLFKRKQLAG